MYTKLRDLPVPAPDHHHHLSSDSMTRLSAVSTRSHNGNGGGTHTHTNTGTTNSTNPALSGGLSMRNGFFVDHHDRVQLLRGVNLGGSSKLPQQYAHVDPLPYTRAQFFDSAVCVSFVNKPFPLAEADFHFARLRRWGLTFLRVMVTWEAIEHAGPGQYDVEYLQYLRLLLEKAASYNLQIYIDPHQDVWSRWTGGDGAPLWTLECIGLEPRHFETTKTAICMETSDHPACEYPKMIWPTNYFKYACATMFTLFWGGHKFAPSCFVDGVQVQEYLQSHYLNAMGELAKALVGLPNIVGFGTMNEPSTGFIGVDDLDKCFHKVELKYGLAPTPFQGMCLAEGHAESVGSWSNGIKQHIFGLPDEMVRVDPQGVRAWKPGYHCVWMNEGVWTDKKQQPQLLQPNYFANVDFGKDFYVPFAQKYAAKIQKILPNAMVFVELPPLEFSSTQFPEITSTSIPHAVNATHWYDGPTLFLQTWVPWFSVDPVTKMPAFGRAAVRRLHEKQLRHIKELGQVEMHHAPTLIGETGIPFNLNGASAYRTGDYSAQIDALDHTITCLEANLLSYTLWCYSSENTHAYGDLWNLEDLSIVSRDVSQNSKNSQNSKLGANESLAVSVEEDDRCARALLAFARPHATKIAGVPTKSYYTLKRRRYELEFTSSDHCLAKSSHEHIIEPTEIHIPHCQYPMGYTVCVSSGKFDVAKFDGYDIVHFTHDEKERDHCSHRVVVTTNDPAIETKWERQQRLHDALLCVVVGLLGVTIVILLSTYW